MTTSKGTIQGYNGQTVADELHQIVVATEAFGVGQDQSLLKPMIEQIREIKWQRAANSRYWLLQ